MTCTAQELTFISWFYGEMAIANFLFLDTSVTFPLTIHIEDGVLIEIVNAYSESAMSAVFDATSTLTTTTLALDMLNVDRIKCGDRVTRSPVIDLTMLNIQGIIFILVYNGQPFLRTF